MTTIVTKAGDLIFRGNDCGRFSARISGWHLRTNEVAAGCFIDTTHGRGRQLLLEAVVLHIAAQFGVKVSLGEPEKPEPLPSLDVERETLDAIAVARRRPQDGEA